MRCASGVHRPNKLHCKEPSTAVRAISTHARAGEGPWTVHDQDRRSGWWPWDGNTTACGARRYRARRGPRTWAGCGTRPSAWPAVTCARASGGSRRMSGGRGTHRTRRYLRPRARVRRQPWPASAAGTRHPRVSIKPRSRPGPRVRSGARALAVRWGTAPGPRMRRMGIRCALRAREAHQGRCRRPPNPWRRRWTLRTWGSAAGERDGRGSEAFFRQPSSF